MLPVDALSVGNATIDVFLTIDEKNPHVKLDKETNELRFGHGEKIEVKKYDLSIGGNAANVAVGISRLGFKSGLVAEIGKDEFSQKIINSLAKEDIDLELVRQIESEASSLSVGINFKSDRTLFVEHVKREHGFEFEGKKTKILFLTSLGSVWEKAYEKTLNFILDNNIELFFNPGTLQIEDRGNLIWKIISHTKILFVNKEEAEELLYGKEIKLPSDSQNYVKKMLYGLKSLGAKIIIITDGQNGSYLMNEKHETYFLEAFKCEIVEKTGAGDAYTSGFIAAALKNEPLVEAMRWGAFNSSAVIGKIGAQQGLLTKDEMMEKIRSNEEFKVREV